MIRDNLPALITIAGAAQLCVLIASALVPIRLRWRAQLVVLPRLHQQMYWVYGGYVVFSIIAFGLICLFNAAELASGSRLARSVCAYMSSFWGIRLSLQVVLDVKEHLTAWWLYAGEVLLTILFIIFTLIFGIGAFAP